MAGLFDPDPRITPSEAPDVFARVPGVAGRPDFSTMQGIAAKAPTFTPPEFPQTPRPAGPDIWLNESTGQIYVQGHVFDSDDAQMALDTEQLLSQPGSGEAPPSGWTPLDVGTWGMHLNSIKNPSLSRLAKKNFGIGVDNMQMLAGRGMQLAGAEQFGGNIVAAQQEDLRKTSPFQRQFTDVDDGRSAVEWLVANFAQQGPNLIESVATALAGFVAGSAVGGPLAGAGGMLASLGAKTAWKEGVKAALKKKAAGEALSTMENKLLREAAGLAGAVAASYAQNMATGAADIYGEFRESGRGPQDMDARLLALAGSVPYAGLESLSEYLLANRILNPGGKALGSIKSNWGKAGELVRRAGLGVAVGGTAEGITEAGQEGLLLTANEGVDWDSPEGMDRLVNSFAAGFGVGGPIGGVANMRGPRNLLEPAKSPEPNTSTVKLNETPPPAATPPATPYGPSPEPLTLQREMPWDMPPPMVGPPSSLALQFGEPLGPEPMSPQQQLPFEAAGDQMDLFGGPALPNEMPPPGPPEFKPPFPPPVAPVPNPAQGAFQFAPPAPTGTQFQGVATPDTAIAQQMQAAQQQQMLDAAYAQREAELAAQQEQMRAQGLARMEGQQQLDMIPPQPAPIDETLANMPMREQRQPTPQQLPLFKRRQAPRPSRGELLRRGMAPVTPTAVQPAVDLEPTGNVQLEMFNNAGQPTVAALKGAGLRRRARPVPAGTGVKQAPPTGKKVTREDIATARAGAEEKAGPKRGLKKQAGVKSQGPLSRLAEAERRVTPPSDAQILRSSKDRLRKLRAMSASGELAARPTVEEEANAVQERSAEAVDAREQAGTGKGMGGENAPVKAAGAGAKLRRSKAAPETGEPDQQEAIVPKNLKPPKEGSHVPKTEAAAAVSAAAAAPAAPASPEASAKAEPEGPVMVSVPMKDGSTLDGDGKTILETLDKKIEAFEALLACLTGK